MMVKYRTKLKEVLEKAELTEHQLKKMTYPQIKGLRNVTTSDRQFLVAHWNEQRYKEHKTCAVVPVKGTPIVNPYRHGDGWEVPIFYLDLDEYCDYLSQLRKL